MSFISFIAKYTESKFNKKNVTKSNWESFYNFIRILCSFTILVILILLILSYKIIFIKFSHFSSITLTSSISELSSDSSSMNDEKTEIEGEYFTMLATTEQYFPEISLHEVNCSNAYLKELEIGIVPYRCGTMITDNLLPSKKVFQLKRIAIKLIEQLGDTNYHNRESFNLKWINLHNAFRKAYPHLLTERDFQIITDASIAAKNAVSIAFALPEDYIYFHGVCQFTRYKPVVPFSEFKHIDKVRSPNLIVTSILWLSTVDEDFGGGRLEFLTGEPNSSGERTSLLVEPKFGRFAAWTSGHENPHGVQEVLYGTRYALIFAFTAIENVGYDDMTALKEWSMITDALE